MKKPVDFTDSHTQIEVQSEIERLQTLFNTGLITNPKLNSSNPFYISVLTEILILLNDLLQKVKNTNRISFKEYIDVNKNFEGDGKNDITDLIRYLRNAVCHIDNDKRDLVKGWIVSFNFIHGYTRTTPDNPPDNVDDLAILMGGTRLYINSHLVRVWEEIKLAYFSMKEFEDFQHRF